MTVLQVSKLLEQHDSIEKWIEWMQTCVDQWIEEEEEDEAIIAKLKGKLQQWTMCSALVMRELALINALSLGKSRARFLTALEEAS